MATTIDDSDDFNRNSILWQKSGEQCITNLYQELGNQKGDFLNGQFNKDQYAVFLQFTSCHYQVPELLYQGKSLEEAEQYKSVGNTYFAKGQYEEALGLYKQSILFAPKTSETLAVSYANRSAVFVKLQKFELALKDIDAAIEEGYPADKTEKLLQRRQACLDFISKTKNDGGPSSSSDEAKPIHPDLGKMYLDPVIEAPKEELRNLNNKVEVQRSEKTGRYLSAAEDIDTGEIILAEKPFAVVQIPDLYRITCHHCSSLIERAVPCACCSRIAFCSETCKESASYHPFECKLLDVLFESGLGKDAYLALRLVTRENPEKFLIEAKCSEEYKSVLNAEFHPEFRDPTEEARIVITTKFLIDCLIKVGYLKEGEHTDIASYVMQFLRAVRFNKLTVDTFLSSHPEEEMYDIAVGMYNTLNMINHSCDPNVFNYFVKDKVVLVAKRPIKKGEEVAFCYGPRFPAVPVEERRKALLEDFRFRCECSACTKMPDVKILSGLNLKVFTQRRLFRCPKCAKLGLRLKIGSDEAKCQECKAAVNSKSVLEKCALLIKSMEGLGTRAGEVVEYKDIPDLLNLVGEFDAIVGSPSEYGLRAEETLMYLIRRLGSSVGVNEIDDDSL